MSCPKFASNRRPPWLESRRATSRRSKRWAWRWRETLTSTSAAGAYIDSEALRTKRPAVDQVSQGLTEAVAAARRHFDPNSLMVARELAAQLAGHGPGLGDHHRMARDFVAGANLTQTEAESMIAGFRTEVRQLADRVMSCGFQLPGQDSNLEKQDQNLL
jgi:hypothetical protein